MCTNLNFPYSTDRNHFSARTMDFSYILPSSLTYHTAGSPIDFYAEKDKTACYGFAGASVFGVQTTQDGMNTEGLSAAILYLHAAQFPEPNDLAPDTRCVLIFEAIAYILSQYKYVKDVYRDMTDKSSPGYFSICSTTEGVSTMIQRFVDAGKTGSAPSHMVVMDAQGESMIIEYVNKELKLYYDDCILNAVGEVETNYRCTGVMTNDPTYDYHLNNLRQYPKLSVHNNPSSLNGSGFLGMPADTTPASRFIRASAYRQAQLYPNLADPAQQEQEQTVQVLRLIQQCEVPIGSVVDGETSERDKQWIPGDFTQWTLVRNHSEKLLYVNKNNNPTLFKIDIQKLCGAESNDYSLEDTDWYRAYPKSDIFLYTDLEPAVDNSCPAIA